eukprot:CAMPEP_0202686022 /NCGR_PEP_ID=MMETSP1385-20130828/1811_1 /ASSEMBLY_ACC=CAM_ASM_000861 /TAXON_ID=933848 /ORGANISM="Elphidium margaritaceum" /LENGTH=304 /DNA_ID=CAMNT_0049340509 /DNA_START=38 /DNA_END=952 /DNA_ORIENTATION=+
MTSSFRPGAAQMPTNHAPSHYAPSRAQHVPQTSTQFNTGAASLSTLQDWARQNDYLDIYMLNAFYLGTAQRSQYFLSLWKLCTCFGLQFYGILILMQQQWQEYQNNEGNCSSDIKGNVAFIGYLFATYISLYCSEQIRTLNRYGMYGWGENQPVEFVNPFWVGIGLWINTFSLFMSWFVSCIIIFSSQDLLAMILNSVAITFMMTLDDEIVGGSDYENIINYTGGGNSLCSAVDNVYAKIGGLLLKIHPIWQRRIAIKGIAFECCDFIVCPFLIVLPFVVLFCYPYTDDLCLYEGKDSLCLGGV